MNKIEEFNNCKVGQLIRVKDVDLLIELYETKSQPDFLIKEKRVFRDVVGYYVALTLDHVGTDLEYLLVCSVYQNLCDIFLFKQPDFFTSDKRCVIQESDNGWLFDGENYPQEIYSDDIVYKLKNKNQIFDDTCICEWETDAKIVDYRLLLIEKGFQHDGGGWVEFYEGRQIDDNHVEF